MPDYLNPFMPNGNKRYLKAAGLFKDVWPFVPAGTKGLRWLVGLKLTWLEQQKAQLPFIIIAKNLKPILYRVIKGT